MNWHSYWVPVAGGPQFDWIVITCTFFVCRYLPLFGSGQYDVVKEKDDDVPFEEQLRGLENVIKAGKVGCVLVACGDALRSGM